MESFHCFHTQLQHLFLLDDILALLIFSCEGRLLQSCCMKCNVHAELLVHGLVCGASQPKPEHTTFQSESNIEPGKSIVSTGWVLLSAPPHPPPNTHTQTHPKKEMWWIGGLWAVLWCLSWNEVSFKDDLLLSQSRKRDEWDYNRSRTNISTPLSLSLFEQ